MKTLVLTTDFSGIADHAVRYGYQLARSMRANVVLVHAFIIPAEVPQAGVVVWPMETYDEILKDNERSLKALKEELESDPDGGFVPSVKILNETGSVAEVVRNAAVSEAADLIVIGTHHPGIGTLLTGNHSKPLIDRQGKPVLLVPPKAKVQLPRKIVFASDLQHTAEDLQHILSLMPLIRTLDAELYITCIVSSDLYDEYQFRLDQFVKEVALEASYPKVFSKLVPNYAPVEALEKLSEGKETDLLVMVHRRHGVFEAIFKGSFTKKTASNTRIPLLVLHSTE